MKKILSSLNEFVEKALELDEEIAVSYTISDGKRYIVATDENKQIKYEELVPDFEEEYVEYDPNENEFVDCFDLLAPLKSHIKSVERKEEVVAYLKEMGVNAYDTDKRRMDMEFAEFIGRSKLESEIFEGITDEMEDDEIKKLAIKIGMEVIRNGEKYGS